MSRRWRMIQVGLGSWGEGWGQLICHQSHWQMAGIVDINPDVLPHRAKDWGLDKEHSFTEYRTAFEQVEADAVLIATPPDSHIPIALAALDFGLHVLIEKPLSASVRQAMELYRSQRVLHSDRLISIVQNYRYLPVVETLHNLLRRGEFGPPEYVQVLQHMPVRGQEKTYRRDLPNGFLLEMALHQLDLMRYLLESEPTAISGELHNPSWSWSASEGTAHAGIKFQNGTWVHYLGGWSAREAETDWFGQWRFECPHGVIITDGHTIWTVHHGEKTVVPIKHGEENNSIEASRVAVLEHFTAALEGRGRLDCALEDNLNSLLMVFALLRSARMGQRVNFTQFRNETFEQKIELKFPTGETPSMF